MLQFFIEGGFVMWPILVFALIFIFVAVRFAIRPARAHLPMLAIVGAVTLVVSFVGVMVDFAQVMHVVGSPRFLGKPDFNEVLMQGLKECTRPGTFGGGLVVLGLLAAAVGAFRLARTPPA